MGVLAVLLALVLPACPTEDSNMCYWDGSEHGNGQGVSFVTVLDTPIYF